MKTKFFVVHAIFFALALPWHAMSAPLKIETIQGPPWGFISSDGKPTGMMYEIGNRVAETAGFSFTNSLVPYARTAFDIESGNADFVLRFGNDQMTRTAVPVATIVTLPIVLVGQVGKHYNNLRELHGKLVGVVRTSKYAEQFDADPAIKKYAVNDYAAMAKMLAMGRLDAGVGSSVGLFYGAYMAGVKPEELGVPLILGSNDFVLFFSKKNAKPETITALKDAVKKLTASGEIARIMSKYTKVLSANLPQK